MLQQRRPGRHGDRRRYVFVDTGSPLIAQSDAAGVTLHGDIDSARAAPTASKAGNLMVALQAFKNLLVANAGLAPRYGFEIGPRDDLLAANGLSRSALAARMVDLINGD